MARVHMIEEIQRLLFTEAEFGRVFDVQIDYLKETVRLDILSINNKRIERSLVLFEQVLSLYMCQFDEIEGIRLNEFNDTDDALLSEISYHPYGFGKIKAENINANLKDIEITSNTNFYFQVNNKDYFFIEANRLIINNKVFNNLLVP
ncbi:hypothetical protein ACIQ1H_19060 [Lysinibacillus sp. NPDC097279]|uniref:YxiG family protein n=1 Tax=Lysinibacillus sp. NPDC097279 TaxID=3364143 RepID=UPI00381F1883